MTLCIVIPCLSWAQFTVVVTIRDSASREPLVGAEVAVLGTTHGALTGGAGQATLARVSPSATIRVSYLGYRAQSVSLIGRTAIEILLSEEAEQFEAVDISSLRTHSRIEDAPIKIEVLGQADLNEENTIKPGNIASILGDLSIINIQQTNATTGSSAVRMQGLDAKYTQILRDGLPLYDGLSGSFGILSMPPLDLKQIEVIKGSVSTLYGGGAIAGLINVVTRTPQSDSTELSATLSQSSLQETNLNAFAAHRSGRDGFTIFSGYNHQVAVDVGNRGYSVIPELRQVNLHPRFFFYPTPATTLTVGYTLASEKRTGGSLSYFKNLDTTAHFFQRNVSVRHLADLQLAHTFSNGAQLNLKSSLSWFARAQQSPTSSFGGQQTVSFSEASFSTRSGAHLFVAGLNLTADRFRILPLDTTHLSDYSFLTLGAFVQDAWALSHQLTIEAGLRLDHHSVFGNFVLPRLALLLKPSEKWVFRLSSGLGYRVPNLFSQQTINADFRFLQPLPATIQAERSLGVNADINYHAVWGDLGVTLNQSFYYSRINHPIILTQTAPPFISATNASFHTTSLGTDTYLRFDYHDIEFYLGYNHTLAQHRGTGYISPVAFSPQDKLSTTLFYEVGTWRMGIEASYIANQFITGNDDNVLELGGSYLPANQRVPNYWLVAAMVGKTWGRCTLVLNAENLFDVRQQRYTPVVLGGGSSPTIRSLWAPIDGRVVNLVVRVRIL